jgi:tRNA uridine 5-carboxymethylaminomethyl modification enzyme
LTSKPRFERVNQKRISIEAIADFLKKESAEMDEINSALESIGSRPVSQKGKIENLLLRPEVNMNLLRKYIDKLNRFLESYDPEIIEEVEIQTKYNKYIEKEKEQAE